MNYLQTLKSKLTAARSGKAGFTMIELLIVITILGILATAVLSAINPIEQINRGRDTGSQSDAEQLISAIDRYYAFNGTYPWQGTGDGAAQKEDLLASGTGLAKVDLALKETSYTGSTVLEELLAKDELKSSFITRIDQATNPLYIYNSGDGGSSSTYVCFLPQSKAFKEQASVRCGDATGTGLPDDLPQAAKTAICGGAVAYHCLP